MVGAAQRASGGMAKGTFSFPREKVGFLRSRAGGRLIRATIPPPKNAFRVGRRASGRPAAGVRRREEGGGRKRRAPVGTARRVRPGRERKRRTETKNDDDGPRVPMTRGNAPAEIPRETHAASTGKPRDPARAERERSERPGPTRAKKQKEKRKIAEKGGDGDGHAGAPRPGGILGRGYWTKKKKKT
jgi:hypothetical protein